MAVVHSATVYLYNFLIEISIIKTHKETIYHYIPYRGYIEGDGSCQREQKLVHASVFVCVHPYAGCLCLRNIYIYIYIYIYI